MTDSKSKMHQHYVYQAIARKLKMAFELIASMSNVLPSRNQKNVLKGRDLIFATDSESSDENEDNENQAVVLHVAKSPPHHTVQAPSCSNNNDIGQN